MPAKQTTNVFHAALLIGGAAVGAGILGLPIQTGLTGFWPAMVGMTLIWVASMATAWVIAGAYLRCHDPKADLATIYQNELGTWAKWLALTGYLINYYGIMVAYLAGAGSVINSLLGIGGSGAVAMLSFFAVATAACLFGHELLMRLNAYIMALLFISLAALLYFTFQHMDAQRLYYVDWGYLPATLPVITCSLAFHNLVPLTCRYMGGNRKRIFSAMVIGSLIPWVVGSLCLLAFIGALPMTGGEASILKAFELDQPATVPLAKGIHSTQVTLMGMIFSLTAIFTSYLGVGAGLMAFWGDLASKYIGGRERWAKPLITFLPPLLVVLIWPDLFLVALDVAGGLGLGIFIGLAPALVLILRRPQGWPAPRLWGVLLLVLFSVVIIMELGQEFGFLHIHPAVEHWTSYVPKK